MSTASISEIYTYPIKSTFANPMREAAVGPRGLHLDRHWAIFAGDGSLITAREHPELLRLESRAGADSLEVRLGAERVLTLPCAGVEGSGREVDVWGVAGTGVAMDKAVNDWFSAFLGTACEVVFMNEASTRPVRAEYGGKSGDVVSYADGCPLLVLSEATVTELNAKLDSPVPVTQFRPNLVVAGVGAGEEDPWNRVKVGGCELEVTEPCKRCVFSTIDPLSRVPHAEQEPLRTLSTYRRHPEGGVRMGVYAIPRSFGNIALGDSVVVLG